MIETSAIHHKHPLPFHVQWGKTLNNFSSLNLYSIVNVIEKSLHDMTTVCTFHSKNV